MKKNTLIAFGMVLTLLTAAGAQDNSSGGLPPVPEQPAPGKGVEVESIDVLVMGSTIYDVQIKVRGTVADACLQLIEPTIRKQEKTFYVSIGTQPAAGVACTQMLQPFEQIIPLNVVDLPPGEYIVDANGTIAKFELK